MRTRITFITSTDTGVGKTLLTSLLLVHLRHQGSQARAIKPFCSGGREDAGILRLVQDGELTLDQINPFYFKEPLAPLVAARLEGRSISFKEVLKFIEGRSRTTAHLLIEGAGGLMVPLGEGYLVADLIARLKCEVIVVAPNKLGCINHTLLTVRALQAAGVTSTKIALMEQLKKDASSTSNRALLSELLSPVGVFTLPFLGPNCSRLETIRKNQKELQAILSEILTRSS